MTSFGRELPPTLACLFLLVIAILRPTHSHFLPSTIEAVAEAQLASLDDMRTLCREAPDLTDNQRASCLRRPPFLRPMSIGAQLGLDECKRQFTFERWNCPIRNDTASYLKVMAQASRESAFVSSVQSAGLMLAVGRTCSTGTGVSEYCGCDTSVKGEASPDENWKWGGCGDNFDKGENFTSEFLDTDYRDETPINMMKIHNNMAGRWAVRDNYHRACKCHGLTGACTVKVCWKSLPKIQQVGIALKEKYRNAHRSRPITVISADAPPSRRLAMVDTSTAISERDLVFLRDSPDYCKRNLTVGSYGIAGRECREDSRGDDGCELLCCGNGHFAKRSVIRQKCHCKFVWCCRVECRQCLEAWETFRCNKESRPN